MNDPKMMNAVQEINHQGTPLLVAMKVIGEGLQVATHKTWRLQDQGGGLVITLPQAVIPFAQDGDMLMVNLAFLKSQVKSPLLRAN
jgi:hypothetical protein